MKLNAGGATHVGLVRDHNEDAFLLDGPLFVVADGMGGHNGGEIASGTTIETFHGARSGLAADPNPVTRLAEVAQAANRAVFAKASTDPELARMGTTLTAAMARDGRLFIAHVGDSRCYRLRDGRLDQLTVDHTLVGEFVREGRITEEQARTHPQRSIITRALGVEPAVPIDSITLEVAGGDRFLICSDGLYGMLYDEEIQAFLTSVEDPQICAEQLIDAANKAGGEDNTTVIVVDIVEAGGDGRIPVTGDEWPTDQMQAVAGDAGPGGPQASAARAEASRAWLLWIIVLLLVLIFLIGVAWLMSHQGSSSPAPRPSALVPAIETGVVATVLQLRRSGLAVSTSGSTGPPPILRAA